MADLAQALNEMAQQLQDRINTMSEEIMNLAANAYKHGPLKGTTFNMRFTLEIPKNAFASKFLAESHLALSLCEEQKRMDDDFATFRKTFRGDWFTSEITPIR